MIDVATTFQFDIMQKNPKHSQIHWKVPQNLSYFNGHFPNKPVLPAVAIIDANELILKNTLTPTIRLKKIISAKFSNLITPGLEIQIEQIQKKPNTWCCIWKNLDGKILAQMVLEIEY